MAFGGWQHSPSPSSSSSPWSDCLKERGSLSPVFPYSLLHCVCTTVTAIGQDLCLIQGTLFCWIYTVRQLSDHCNYEISYFLAHFKAFCCVVSYCLRKFCTELNTKHYIVMYHLMTGKWLESKHWNTRQLMEFLSIAESQAFKADFFFLLEMLSFLLLCIKYNIEFLTYPPLRTNKITTILKKKNSTVFKNLLCFSISRFAKFRKIFYQLLNFKFGGGTDIVMSNMNPCNFNHVWISRIFPTYTLAFLQLWSFYLPLYQQMCVCMWVQ